MWTKQKFVLGQLWVILVAACPEWSRAQECKYLIVKMNQKMETYIWNARMPPGPALDNIKCIQYSQYWRLLLGWGLGRQLVANYEYCGYSGDQAPMVRPWGYGPPPGWADQQPSPSLSSSSSSNTSSSAMLPQSSISGQVDEVRRNLIWIDSIGRPMMHYCMACIYFLLYRSVDVNIKHSTRPKYL